MHRAAPARASAELDRFCVAICHDLRGPVSTAGAAMRGLELSIPEAGEEPRRWLEIARRSLERADELLLSLPLLVAREVATPRERVSLGELLAVARADVAPELELAEGRLAIRPPLATVRGDPDRLRIALRNLLRNAIQHRSARAGLEITVRAWRRGARVTLTLSDNGSGLPRSERARLRGRLRPGRSPSGGLGLAIARAAVEASGGTLAAMSRAGLGTTFPITLPLAGAARPRAAELAPRPGNRNFRPPRGAPPPTRP
jgi:two-component system, OmpR family, sensor kinase